MRGIQRASVRDGFGRFGIQIRMMPFRERAIRGPDLCDGAVAIESQRGVVIWFCVFQCATLPRRARAASLTSRAARSNRIKKNCGGGERQFPGGARDSRAVCGDSPQTPEPCVFVSGVQI